MNTKNSSISFLLVSALAVSTSFNAFAAKPEVGNVTVSQDKFTRVVTVEYTLSSEPGIVTLDIQTNGVSIGSENFLKVQGDVNKVVAPGGEKKTITWYPHIEWPNRKITDGSLKAVVNAWATNCPPMYMAYNTIMKKVTYYPSAEAVPYGVTSDVYKTDCILMRKIPAQGMVFRMGAARAETAHDDLKSYAVQEYAHLVGFTKDFYIAVYPVTQQQFYNIKGWYPSSCTVTATSGKQPVTGTSYETLRGDKHWPKDGDAVGSSSVFKTLRDASGIPSFDLPTDAQWEFACRAGTASAHNDGTEYDGTSRACAWTQENSGNAIHDVGATGIANGYGLYDMLGNYWELVKDMFSNGSDYSDTFVADWKTGGITWDPKGKYSDTYGNRVRRGGNFNWAVKYARSAYRDTVAQTGTGVTFRPVCAAEAPVAK